MFVLFACQRLCEELEYTELLDKAADIDDPFERMVRLKSILALHEIINLNNV
jgi:hypothetical protein